MSELTIHPVVSLPFVAVASVLLVGLLFVQPRYAELSRWRRAALVGLRLLITLLVIVAMLRPTYSYVKETPQRASLVILIDSSQSMQVADSLGDASRWLAARSLLDEVRASLAKLAEHWDIKAYTFDEALHPVPIEEGDVQLPDSPDGQQTAIGAALDEALRNELSGMATSLLLLSDGAQRAVPPLDTAPQVVAGRLGAANVPLYTFTLGKPGGSDQADLSIHDLVTDETIFAEAPTEVRVLVEGRGFVNKTAQLQMLWENLEGEMDVVATRQLTIGHDGEPIPVLLTHTPTEPGEHKLTVRLQPGEGELITKNNEASTFVTVREGGIQVLYLVGTKRIGGTPGREQRFVRAALAASPDVVVQRRVFDYRQPRASIVDLLLSATFDVTILDDVDSIALNRESWQALADRTSDGMGLMMLGGYHSYGPGGFRDTPLAAVLPVQMGPAERQNFDEPVREDMQLAGPLKIRPTEPFGIEHPIMQISPEGDVSAAWDELPPLDGANLLERNLLKPNAIVLAEADRPAREPLLVAGQYGTGRTLAFAGDSTWRWQLLGFGEALRRFWRQCVLWLAKKDAQTEGLVWIRLEGRQVTRGSRVDFELGAEDPSRAPIANPQFNIEVVTPDGSVQAVRPSKSGDSWQATFRGTQTPGDYTIQVTAHDGQAEVGTAQARFLVPDRDLELEHPAAEPGLMAQLARLTSAAGGRALAAEELPALLARLAAQPPELKREVLSRVTYWDTWPFFLLFVGLLGVEWYLRKRWRLV